MLNRDDKPEKTHMTDYALIADLAAEMPEIPPDSIVSRTVHTDDVLKAVLFGFAAGQELSEHTASMPATLFFVQGEANLTLGEDTHQVSAGAWVHMPPHLPHSITARTPVVMLLLLLRGGGDSA
jgi:quercetin dioxygenase-like cupin family protein